MQRPPIPRTAALLGFGGALPFAFLAIAAWAAPIDLQPVAVEAQIAYGATILSFLGAAQWGAELTRPKPDPSRLVWSVIPALLAWVGLILPPGLGLATLIGGTLACYAMDQRAIAEGLLPLWYSGLRQPLTVLVCLLLALTLLRQGF